MQTVDEFLFQLADLAAAIFFDLDDQSDTPVDERQHFVQRGDAFFGAAEFQRTPGFPRAVCDLQILSGDAF